MKRFCDLEEKHFPSTSTVASADFLEQARGQLAEYREVAEPILDPPRVREDRDWPYDGDLLFMETLTKQRLKNSYGSSILEEEDDWLQEAREKLSVVYRTVKQRPSPYYAIIALDGDGIGQRINACLSQPDPQQAHEQFSRQLAQFSDQAKKLVPSLDGSLIYNGGDDVLAMAPLSTAFPLAQALAHKFFEIANGTASVGITIAHHLFPLGAALQAARQAEKQAKRLSKEKNAVCVRVLKRSGETLEIRSSWTAVGDTFAKVIDLFTGDVHGELLSAKFAYDVLGAAFALPEANEKSQAELKRLLTRHRNNRHPHAPDPQEWAARLQTWAAALPEQLEELGRWLVFARFLAQGGRE